MSSTFLLVCFLSLKIVLMKLGKMFFISLQKYFSYSRKSKFKILDIQISWRHQMPKHKKGNTFYRITFWEISTVCLWNLASLYHITKEKMLSKNSTETATWKLVPDSCVCKDLSTNTGKWNFWSKFLILDMQEQYQHADLLRFFFAEDSLKIKKGLELVSRSLFT